MKRGMQITQVRKDTQIYSSSVNSVNDWVFSTELLLFINIIFGNIHLVWKKNILGGKDPPISSWMEKFYGIRVHSSYLSTP